MARLAQKMSGLSHRISTLASASPVVWNHSSKITTITTSPISALRPWLVLVGVAAVARWMIVEQCAGANVRTETSHFGRALCA